MLSATEEEAILPAGGTPLSWSRLVSLIFGLVFFSLGARLVYQKQRARRD